MDPPPPPPDKDPPPPPDGDEDFLLPLGEDEDELPLGEDEDEVIGDGLSGSWNEARFPAATGWFEEVGCCEPVSASAVPAATAAIATLAASPALTALMCLSLMRRTRGIWFTVVLCTVGGAPAPSAAR